MTTSTTFTRRSLLAVGGAAAAGLLGMRVSAHNDPATPDASPSASPSMSMMNTGTGATFMHIANAGAAPDRLIAGATKVARIVEIHEMTMVDGVMKMAELKDGLEIPAGGEVQLEPGGYHVMLINLTQDLKPDSTFDLDLTFANAGTTTVTVTVTNAAPTDTEPTVFGDLTLTNIWSRPAPMITAGTGMGNGATPPATPAAAQGH
ncbi:MAG: copper chaperone PCu(A)C [Thermomicrobiales bacterium]